MTRTDWPELAAEEGSRDEHERAVGLLLDAGMVSLLAAKDQDGNAVMALFVEIPAGYRYTDYEPLPPVGFSDHDEASFWALYDAVRADGTEGAKRWVSARRHTRTETAISTGRK